MGKASSLADEVLASVANSRPGGLTWFDRLPQDAQHEMLRLRDAFDPAVHQKRAFYRALKTAAEKRGWQLVGEKQFGDWLRQR
jgi:hypothetical protein